MRLNHDGTSKILNEFIRLEVVDYRSGSGGLSYTYTANDATNPAANYLKGIIIANDHASNSLTVTVNGIVQTVIHGERIELNYHAFGTVAIAANGAWRLWLLQ